MIKNFKIFESFKNMDPNDPFMKEYSIGDRVKLIGICDDKNLNNIIGTISKITFWEPNQNILNRDVTNIDHVNMNTKVFIINYCGIICYIDGLEWWVSKYNILKKVKKTFKFREDDPFGEEDWDVDE